jgi:transporter family-2 protein
MIWYLLSAIAGISFVVQQAVNSQLRGEIASPWWAGFVSYLGGTIVMFIVAVTLREPLQFEAIGRSSWVSWSGGLFGAIYIAISILMLPRLGAATVVALIVLGQIVGALALDHFGLLGVTERSITPTRIVGAALLVFGVVLTRA